MKITVLVNNRAPKNLIEEHGLALYIEYKEKRILFDTGQGKALLHNAKKLQVDLSHLDFIILSHGHYDHGGNMAAVLAMNPTAIIVAHPHSTVPRYSLHENKPVKSVALTQPNSAAIINRSSSLVQWCFGPKEICEGLWISGEIPRNNSYEDTGGPFFLDPLGDTKDLIPDDIALWVENGESLSLVTGCCHSGVVNTIQYIESFTGKAVHTLVGGLHLVNADNNRISRTIAALSESKIEKIFPLHCTGEEAEQRLEKAFPNYFSTIRSGDQIEV